MVLIIRMKTNSNDRSSHVVTGFFIVFIQFLFVVSIAWAHALATEAAISLASAFSSINIFLGWRTGIWHVDCVLELPREDIPNANNAIYSTADYEILWAVQGEHITLVADTASCWYCKVVIFGWLSPHHELTTPTCTEEPKLSHAVNKFEISNFWVTMCEIVEDSTALEIYDFWFSRTGPNCQEFVGLINCSCCDSSLHR